MEPDVLDLQAAAKGLALFGLIPVVSFALWTDYLVRYVDQMTIKNPKFDRNGEIEKVRVASLLVILFQVGLFLGSSEIREAYPLYSQLSFMALVFLQLFCQSRTEKKIQVEENRGDDLFRLATRVGFSWLIGGALYGLVLIGSIKVAAWIALKTQVSPVVGNTLLLLGGGGGVILGLALNFFLSPLFFKSILPNESLKGTPLARRLETCFTKARLDPPTLWTFDLSLFQVNSVILVGFQKSPGRLKSALFIPRFMLSTLEPSELEALVLNQVSHLTLKHLRKRFLFAFCLVLVTTLFSILSVVAGEYLFPQPGLLSLILPAVALASFFASFNLLASQSKKHELEADLHSIQHLNVPMSTLISALKKLHPPVAQDTMPVDFAVADNEQRIELIEKYCQTKDKHEDKPESKAS